MPRKYHRPPDTTSKRRKTRKTAIPYEFAAPPAEPAVAEDEVSENGDRAVASSEPARLAASGGETSKAERHITVDYGYVRGEVVRIAAIMAFLVIALIITSIFR